MVREIEIKVMLDCDTVETVRGRLLGLGARPVSRRREEDIYYAHPCRDFRVTDEALRLRRSGDETRLTYKGPRTIVGGAKSREEIEVEAPGDIAAILERLGFQPRVRVVKEREYYKLPGALVSLDKVEGLGCFVEAESRGASPEELERILEEIGARGERVEESYAELVARASGMG